MINFNFSQVNPDLYVNDLLGLVLKRKTEVCGVIYTLLIKDPYSFDSDSEYVRFLEFDSGALTPTIHIESNRCKISDIENHFNGICINYWDLNDDEAFNRDVNININFNFLEA